MNKPLRIPVLRQSGGAFHSRKARRKAPWGLWLLALLAVAATVALAAVLLLNNWGLSLSGIVAQYQRLPTSDSILTEHPATALLETPNRLELQGENQCAGYNMAYLLRFYGEETDGAAAYDTLGHKLSSGYVLPRGLVEGLRARGYAATCYRGGLDQLKARVFSGGPVIALIGQGRQWQHYVTVVGYDESGLYLYDSMQPAGDKPSHNRYMTTAEFTQAWENGIPLFENSYIAVEIDAYKAAASGPVPLKLF